MSKRKKKKQPPKLTPSQLRTLAVISEWREFAYHHDAMPICCLLAFEKNGLPTTRMMTPFPKDVWPHLVEELRSVADGLEESMQPPAAPEPSAN
jgi:hypothetical protein